MFMKQSFVVMQRNPLYLWPSKVEYNPNFRSKKEHTDYLQMLDENTPMQLRLLETSTIDRRTLLLRWYVAMMEAECVWHGKPPYDETNCEMQTELLRRAASVLPNVDPRMTNFYLGGLAVTCSRKKHQYRLVLIIAEKGNHEGYGTVMITDPGAELRARVKLSKPWRGVSAVDIQFSRALDAPAEYDNPASARIFNELHLPVPRYSYDCLRVRELYAYTKCSMTFMREQNCFLCDRYCDRRKQPLGGNHPLTARMCRDMLFYQTMFGATAHTRTIRYVPAETYTQVTMAQEMDLRGVEIP